MNCRLIQLFIIFLVTLGACKMPSSSKESSLGKYTGPQLSCGDFMVVLMTPSKMTCLKIQLNVGELQLSQTNIFEIPGSDLQVTELIYEQEIDGLFCNDIGFRHKIRPIHVNNAQSGRVKVLLESNDLINFNSGRPYAIDIIIEELVFENNDSLMNLKILNATVGWLPG